MRVYCGISMEEKNETHITCLKYHTLLFTYKNNVRYFFNTYFSNGFSGLLYKIIYILYEKISR